MPDGPWTKYQSAAPAAPASGAAKSDLSLADRLKLFATEGQKHIFGHELPQVAAGALPDALGNALKIPPAVTEEDQRNRTAGNEMDLALLARKFGNAGALTPPALRGGANGSWGNVPDSQIGGGILAPKITSPMAPFFHNPITQGLGALGAGGAGAWALLKHLGIVP